MMDNVEKHNIFNMKRGSSFSFQEILTQVNFVMKWLKINIIHWIVEGAKEVTLSGTQS
jgi:hypothetical protein